MNTKLIAATFLSIILIVSGIVSLLANSLGWKKFKISFFTLVFLSEVKWNQPIAKVFNISWGLIQYSIGFWLLVTQVF